MLSWALGWLPSGSPGAFQQQQELCASLFTFTVEGNTTSPDHPTIALSFIIFKSLPRQSLWPGEACFGGWMVIWKKIYAHCISQNLWPYLEKELHLCWCNCVQDLEVSSSWIIGGWWGVHKSRGKYPYKIHRGEGCVKLEAKTGATRNQKRQERILP